MLTKEHAKLHEYFLSITCNLMTALSTNKDTKSGAGAKGRICMERLCFKFVENRFEKLIRLVQLHKLVYGRLSEFDLAEFTQSEEIKQLEEHFNLDLLVIVDSILAILCSTTALSKFFSG